MEKTVFYIKNMVCNRCIMAVEHVLQNFGLKPLSVILGEAVVEGKVDDETSKALDRALREIGFEMIDDNKSMVIEKIKTNVIRYIHYDPELIGKINFSDFLAEKLGYDYSYLSTLFSSVEGITIEKYLILQRIEKVKELLIYDELTLSEIAYRLNYSSVQHLSNQFKKITGFSPSAFKNQKKRKRNALDNIGHGD